MFVSCTTNCWRPGKLDKNFVPKSLTSKTCNLRVCINFLIHYMSTILCLMSYRIRIETVLFRWINIQSARNSLQQNVFQVFSMNSLSNWTPDDSFGICLSWGFRNTPYMFNLMKFWLRYLRLKTKLNFQSVLKWYPLSLTSIISAKT